MQEENRQLHSKVGDLEVVALMARKEATDAKDALKVAHEINSSTIASKDEALKREGEASKLSVTSEANSRSLLNKQSAIESASDRLKTDLAAAIKAAADAQAAAQKDRLAVNDLTDKLNAATIKLGELQTAKDKEYDLLSGQVAASETRVNEHKQKTSSLEASNKKLASEISTKTNELTDKISQLAFEKKLLEDKAVQLDADLNRALKDERDVRTQALSYEQKALAAHQEKETTLSELRVAKAQVESLSAEKKALEEQKRVQYLEIEALKAQALKLQQEKAALEQSVKDVTARSNELNQQLQDVQTQLRVKMGECETLTMRVADLENQMSGVPALKKENLAQKSKLRDLEDLIAALKAENARVTEAELRYANVGRSLLVYNRSILMYNRSLLMYNRSLLM
jgi:hypothetical protein